MTRILARQDPGLFKTQAIQINAMPDRLHYRPIGRPLNFAQMMEKRKPIRIREPYRFEATLANLGVSVRLTLTWQDRDYWLVVCQQRRDRNDRVLKWISGYVPGHALTLPLLTAVQEVAEECLIETETGWLPGRFDKVWMETPYRSSLPYNDSLSYRLRLGSRSPLTICAADRILQEAPHGYVHLPTASLQLVYDLQLTVPVELDEISLYHVDQQLENGVLIDRLDPTRPDLYLIALHQNRPNGHLFTLQKGRLQPVDTDRLWLSEGFATQTGWVIEHERIRFSDWLAASCDNPVRDSVK